MSCHSSEKLATHKLWQGEFHFSQLCKCQPHGGYIICQGITKSTRILIGPWISWQSIHCLDTSVESITGRQMDTKREAASMAKNTCNDVSAINQFIDLSSFSHQRKGKNYFNEIYWSSESFSEVVERERGVFSTLSQSTTADNNIIHQSRNHDIEFLPKWMSGGRVLQASEKVAAG